MDRRTHLKPPSASFRRERQASLLLYRAEVVAAFGMARGGNDSDRSPGSPRGNRSAAPADEPVDLSFQ